MKLDIYAGKKRIVTLVPYYPVDQVTGKLSKEWDGEYAIPGMKTANEDTVRSWANEYGYSVRKRYEYGDDYGKDVCSVGLGRGEAGDYSVCFAEPTLNFQD